MSFQDLESGRSLALRREYINGKQDPTQAVASGVFQINTAVSTFQRLVNSLGTPKDTPELREKLETNTDVFAYSLASSWLRCRFFSNNLVILHSILHSPTGFSEIPSITSPVYVCRSLAAASVTLPPDAPLPPTPSTSTRNTRLHIGQLVKDTSAKLKQASETDQHTEVSASKKIADAKLAKDFQAVLKEFQKGQRLAAERETAYAPFVPQAVLPSSYTASEVDLSSDKSPKQLALLVESRRWVSLMFLFFDIYCMYKLVLFVVALKKFFWDIIVIVHQIGCNSVFLNPEPRLFDGALMEPNKVHASALEWKRVCALIAEVLLLDNETVFNEAIIEEREQGIQEIQQHIGEVNEIFKDLAVLVHEQGAMIDDIDSNVEGSYAATAQAKHQLAKASKTQKSKSSMLKHGKFVVSI
ncbi:hypothetical protein HHK36_028467 [Tetracentron sinense]|uniref:t-SNARE coiled-coil homology domain-containing protein n=1 Tax=Tetracentron sinense TaxID=13715 RepID=A0A834YF30_TETSI|nr:hypothetical protein HHK36_028467 [Tetracentron sinense]